MERQRNFRRVWHISLLVLVVTGTFLLARHNRPAPFRKDSGTVFGTFYNITYQSEHSLKDSIELVLQAVDDDFSMFNEKSTVSRLNRGEPGVAYGRDFATVLQLAREVSDETAGAFDVRVAPLVNAWGFGFKNEQMPTPQQVDSLLKIRSQMDFSAIAKGWGVDCVARFLEAQGVSNYMVEIGGEVRTRGVNAKEQPWRIGITKPSDDPTAQDGELQTVLSITDMALATSGNYRNFYYKDGRKYAHTIDPRTGYPVQHNILSATVLASQCATADAYATAFMVLGLDGSREVLNRHPELMAYLIYTDSSDSLRVWCSPRMAMLTN